MNRATGILLVLFLIACLSVQLFTLTVSPLPWGDEVFFAGISKSFAETGKLFPQTSYEMWNGEEVRIYGPVHFLLESMSFRFFGFGIFQYRWITLVFGMLAVLATGVVLRYIYPASKLYMLLILTFALDPFIDTSMHEGRMDLVAVFFMLLSVLFLMKAMIHLGKYLYIASGFFAAIALLTTPRVCIVSAALFLAFLMQLEGKSLKEALLLISCWLAPAFILYSLWTFYAFGGYIQLFDYYLNIQPMNSEFQGGKFYIPAEEYLLIGLTLLSMVYGIYQRKKEYFNFIVIVSLLSLLAFYIIVPDKGPYSSLILPFYYLLFFHGLYHSDFSWKNRSVYPMLLLFVFNLCFFTLRSAQMIAESEMRDPEKAAQFIEKNIPKGSRVIGDPQYYYAVIKEGSDYRCYDEFLSPEQRERILREVYDYDYLIVTARSLQENPEMVKLLLQNATFLKVAELNNRPSSLAQKIAQWNWFSVSEKYGYNAVLFVRQKDHLRPLAYSKMD